MTDHPPLPAELQIEVTAACNLRCAMCLVRYQPPVNKMTGSMSFPLFRRIVDGVSGLRKLTLQGLGEPLLSPHLLPMIRYAKSMGVAVGFNSNATLLSRHTAGELVDAGLDWLHVSVDGATAATYEGIREGAQWDKVMANLRGLIAAKQAAGRQLPWVRVVFVAMRRNVDELPALVELLAAVGVDELRVQNLAHSFDDTDPSSGYTQIREFTAAQALWTGTDADRVSQVFDQARKTAEREGMLLRLPALSAEPAAARDQGTPGCTWPWDSAYITSQGVVQPCCMVMGDDRVALGRLDTEDFATIWYGTAYTDFRRRLRTDDPPDVCRGCALYQRVF